MWRVLKKMTECTKSAVMLDGELSKFFDIEQGVPQGCTLSPTLFQVFINDLLEVVEAVRKGVKVGDTETSVSGMLFADDFVAAAAIFSFCCCPLTFQGNEDWHCRNFACVDPNAPCVDDDSVTVDMIENCRWSTDIGDGYCSEDLNTPECGRSLPENLAFPYR
ncbi:unnamed protein product [Ectocarpus sp. CCAP 1310/34]|nr:unnamed protein product [Ectocarpus sp. CCAP 1310/34]